MLSLRTRQHHAATAWRCMRLKTVANCLQYARMEMECYGSLISDLVDDPLDVPGTIVQDFKSRWREFKRAYVDAAYGGHSYLFKPLFDDPNPLDIH